MSAEPTMQLRAVRPPIAVLGVPLDNVTTDETVRLFEEMIASRRPHYVVTANVDFLTQAVTDVELRRILFDSDLALCDGTPVLWASRLLGNALPERVAGADFVPLFIRVAAEKKYRLFFLGSSPQTAETAVKKLRRQYPDIIIAGHYSPPFSTLLEMDHEEICRRILEARPDVLFVCFGCPKQEKWMAMHYRRLGVPVSIGVGGTMDFVAGSLKRAPLWMQRSGTEWIFRLVQEPRRLFKRYVRDMWVFGRGIAAQWWRLKSRARLPTMIRALVFRRKSPPPESGDPPARLEQVAADRTERAPQPSQENASYQVVTLSSRWDCAAVRADPALLDKLLRDGRHCFLRLENIAFLDSTGVGFLIRLRKTMRAAGRQLVLVAPSREARRALSLMKLDHFFLTADNLESAEQVLQVSLGVDTAAVHAPMTEPVIAWRYDVTAANAAEVWEQTLSSLTRSGRAEWKIDLGQLDFIDSTGLGLMIRVRKLAERQGIPLRFVNPQPAVRNVVRVAGLDELLFFGQEVQKPPERLSGSHPVVCRS
jgi:N-acetylglucosaminyldiphosphoundecaprenol N-acetyl-beta-D-mannosaminyltransferase